MKRQYSIGIVTPNDLIKKLPFGGASGFILNILKDLKISVKIFGVGANGTALWEPVHLTDNAIFIPTYSITYPSSVPLRVKALAGYLNNRNRILKSGVDLLYIHSPECAIPFIFRKSKNPVVFHQHGSGNPVSTAKFKWARNHLFEILFDLIHKLIYKRADWIIAIDRLCYGQALRGGAGNKVSLIMNTVDTGVFRPDNSARQLMRKKYTCENEKNLILFFVGRLEEIKNVNLLIDAIALTRKDEVPVQLFIAGDGTVRKFLEEKVHVNNLSASVVFLGKVSHDALPGFYNMADALVLPSKMEGVPMVILESLACGTPVIASAVGGIPDLICHGVNGILLDRVSPKQISEVFHKMKHRDWDRSHISQSVSQWSAENVTDQLMNIFDRLITQGKNVI